MRDSLVTLLSLNGHDVTGFGTGQAFLEAAENLSGTGEGADLAENRAALIDCVVCEAELPDTSGLELFRAFKPGHPETRFALLTSRNDHSTVVAARTCGVDAVFRKPLVSQRLRAFVQRL